MLVIIDIIFIIYLFLNHNTLGCLIDLKKDKTMYCIIQVN